MKRSRYWLAAVLMGSFLGMAHASTATSEVRQMRVYFGDLDLNSRMGAAVLYRRIESAARSVCELPNERMLVVQVKVRRCVKQATEHAFTDANTPSLAGTNASRTVQVVTQGVYSWSPNP